MKKIFMTGTDTDVGKTYVSTLILQHFNQQSLKTVALKPVASGASKTAVGLENADALCLQKNASINIPYADVNPWVFSPAIAPHIAAHEANCDLSTPSMVEHCEKIANTYQPDVILLEGCGGLFVPLNARETFVDLMQCLQWPIILVVGMRLGCLNHALLSAELLLKRQLPVQGWIANEIDPRMQRYRENLQTLKEKMNIPFLREIKYGATSY